jgi:predicted lipoprotein with Yx(FWY)xxD motif
MKSKTSILIAVTAISCAFLTACSKDDNKDTNNPEKPVAKVQVTTDATLGKVLTDSAGRTLYFYTKDAGDTSTCTGGCLAAWPLFYSADLALTDTSLHASDFATIVRGDGSKQTTYKGWPLYYYVKDTLPKLTLGEKVGNVWYVAKPDYSVMLVNAQLVGLDGVDYTSTYAAGNEITQYLTDAWGRTLYAFSPDKFKKNTFTSADFSNNSTWPVYESDAFKFAPSLLTKTDFDTIHVSGHVQLTYKGWPLYYFGADAMTRGNNKGVSVPRPGVWPIVNNNSTTAPQP